MKKWTVRAGIGFVVVAGILGVAFWLGSGDAEDGYTAFEARRGPLDIKVVEGGEIEALESQEVKSQVKGWQGTKILSIIEEGYFVTDEDVENKKVLVELDSSELQEKLTTSEISFKGTQASLTEAVKGYDIQVNQSQSDIYAAQLETKAAEKEMEKYLGFEVTQVVLAAIDAVDIAGSSIVDIDASNSAMADSGSVDGAPSESDLIDSDALVSDAIKSDLKTAKPKTPDAIAVLDAAKESLGEEPTPKPEESDALPEIGIDELRLSHPDVDFSQYAEEERLGDGSANQELSKLISEVKLSEQEKTKAESELEGKERLFEKKFITENELKTATLMAERNAVNLTSSRKSRDIFVNYEFPKMAEKLMSDFIQSVRKLQRTEQQALSQIAQSRAKMASAEARFKIESERINEYQDQIDKCVMVAERAGLVVYGGSGRSYWDEEPIKAGSTVRERQAIITIPDMSTMAVKVNVHESDIKKIAVGQPARIRIDAFTDRRLQGEVSKVAVLPNAENRWMNPDLKVYETTIKVSGRHEWVKPGMSAEVQILTKRLDDAVYIPLQSVVPQGDERVCFVIENGEPVRRVVETAEITVEYIVITKGLDKDERVLIRPPEGTRKDVTTEEEEEPFDFETEDEAAGEIVEEVKESGESEEPVENTDAKEGDDSDESPETEESEDSEVDTRTENVNTVTDA